ncbi:hypothetical protein QUB63_00525 [Microcoleus sp. ARI1-B5]
MRKSEVLINKKFENLPILGLAAFAVKATAAFGPTVDRMIALFSFLY